ncbi:LysR family transcriptional regulator [Jatrophihabitans telluris]|uniref:LysR family transcriptional regulator n=1 Tax=Jatrophihabitans telluris TaxID=2038343 RepID=A0ABY4QZK4_9ACTN|nr:LysR family transcriptional regulator [Jatrophihabitans telluris]UQX88753.1 LysR family transcriptional regulator [Jatrophihabitans telluris]
MPDLESLRLLVLIADAGSIGAAATVLGVSQPAASKRIRYLERELGLALLERQARGSTLTDQGRTVTDWARNVLAATQTLLVGARAMQHSGAARLTTAASQTVAEYLFPHWLAALSRTDAHPSVALRVANSARVIELVRNHDVELGFIESPSVPRDLAGRTVATDRLVVVVAPSHPWSRRRTPVGATDLLDNRLVLREAGSGTRATLERVLPGAPQDYLELDSNAAVKVVVASGTGVAVLSALAVAGELADGRLVEVATSGLDLRRPLRAVWPRGRRLLGAAAEFLAII